MNDAPAKHGSESVLSNRDLADGGFVPFILIVTALYSGVAFGAVVHGLLGLAGGKVVLWCCSLMLAALTFITGLSIGGYFLFGTILSVVTAAKHWWGRIPTVDLRSSGDYTPSLIDRAFEQAHKAWG